MPAHSKLTFRLDGSPYAKGTSIPWITRVHAVMYLQNRRVELWDGFVPSAKKQTPFPANNAKVETAWLALHCVGLTRKSAMKYLKSFRTVRSRLANLFASSNEVQMASLDHLALDSLPPVDAHSRSVNSKLIDTWMVWLVRNHPSVTLRKHQAKLMDETGAWLCEGAICDRMKISS